VVQERTTGCLGVSRLLDAGIVAGCEGDVPAALTMLWGQVVSGRPAFMANPQELDPRTGRLWLAHCTIATRLVTDHVLRSHFESGLGVGIQGTVPPGDATVVRIGGTTLRDLFVSDGRVGDTEPVEQRCRTQLVVELVRGVDSLLTAPLGNHHILLRGHHEAALREYHRLFIEN
jgi:L-fucose isomerase-like protein